MAAYNAEPYLRQAIRSILGQTLADLELIVVDDASTDATSAIAASFDDPRLRLIRMPANLGAVRARNAGFALARGDYLAIQDADDISHPTRLARQAAHLDRHAGDVLVASDIRQMHPNGEMIRPRTGGPASPLLLEWMLHLGNPIGFSSVMMRMAVLRGMPAFLREARRYAEDYDLYGRLLPHGGFARLAEPLLIYRVHPQSCSALNRASMLAQTGAVMSEIWAEIWAEISPGISAQGAIGGQREQAAALMARTLSAGLPAENASTLRAVRDGLQRLSEGFLARHPGCTPAERKAVLGHAGRLWEGLVRASLRAGTVTWPAVPFFSAGTPAPLRKRDLVGAALRGMVPRRLVETLRPPPSLPADPYPAPAGIQAGRPVAPPVLFVAVCLHGRQDEAAAAFLHPLQSLFEAYGLRPAYLLDAAIADQPPVCAALRAMHEGGLCGIGAWWRQGTASVAVEALLARITAACGVAPAYTTSEASRSHPVIKGRADPVGRLTAIPLSRGMIVPPLPAATDSGGLAHEVCLRPDDVGSQAQIALIRTMLARGERRFFVRLDLRPGDDRHILARERLARVSAWFFEDLGGLPGDVRVLALDRRRGAREDGAVALMGVG